MESAWEIMHEVDVELARDIADTIDEDESRNNSSRATAVYYVGQSSVFNKHLKDDNLIENILSFCDFHSAVETGKTCKRLKKIADDCLDHASANIAHNVKNMLPMSICGYSGGDNTEPEAILRKNNWTYGTRAALIEDGIELCNGYEYANERNYDEGQARYLLQTRGYVDVRDFIIDQDDMEMADEDGWNVKCRLRQINRQKAATEIMFPEDDYGDGEYVYDEENDRIIRYYSLCLLRKADPSSIQYGFLKAEGRHPDYPSYELRFSVMFKLSSSATNDNGDNGTKFEFYYTREHQCHD